MIRIERLNYETEGTLILDGISAFIKKGRFTGVIGPNGSGKSTLLKNIYKAIEGTGEINFKEKKLKTISIRELAKQMAVVSQHGSSDFDLTVEEIVTMGRYPHKGILKGYNQMDRKIVSDTLSKMDLGDLSTRGFMSLSGGERQRVLIARALTQEAEVIVLDEPTNHLDIKYQLQIMEILKGLGITVVAAVHDMNIAALYCDDLIALKDGRIRAAGKTEKVFSEKFFKDIFSIDVEISRNPRTNRMSIIYLPEKEGY